MEKGRAKKKRRLEVGCRRANDRNRETASVSPVDLLPVEIQTMILSLATGGGDSSTYDVCRFVCSMWWRILPRPLMNERTCNDASKRGRLAVIRWARENGCPWGMDVYSNAARGGHLGVLEWAWDNGCPWSVASTCAEAAEGGHLDVLRWAREKGFPWGGSGLTSTKAAAGGHPDVLLWAIENGCPISDDALWRAAESGWSDVLRWIKENVNGSTRHMLCVRAAEESRFSVLEGLLESGRQWNAVTLYLVQRQLKADPSRLGSERVYPRIWEMLRTAG